MLKVNMTHVHKNCPFPREIYQRTDLINECFCWMFVAEDESNMALIPELNIVVC